MSHFGYFFATVIIVTSGLLSIGSTVENKICFNVSNQRICYFQSKVNTWEGRRDWESARKVCAENNATLPIIENEEVQMTFELYLRNISLNTNYGIWLGGRQEVTKKEWQWSNKRPFYQPDLISDGDHKWRTQAVITRTSSYADDLPSNTTIRYEAAYTSWLCYYICQYTDSRCTGENSTQKEHYGCLRVFSNQQLNASEAAKECNKHGGHLAIFEGDEFLTKAPKVYQQMNIRSTSYICFYIGLQRINTTEWFWIRSKNENSTMEGNYNNWSDRNNNSNGDCLFATANNLRWEASSCFAWKHCICQTITPVPIRTYPTSMKSTTATTSDSSSVSSMTVGLVLGLGVVVPLLIVIIILIITNLNLKKKLRKMSVSRGDTTLETHQYQELQRPGAYANSSDNYEELRLQSSPE